jgi:hypothetical protein
MALVRVDLAPPDNLACVTRIIVDCSAGYIESAWKSFWSQPASHQITHVQIQWDAPELNLVSTAVSFLRMVPNLQRASIITKTGVVTFDSPTFNDVFGVLSQKCKIVQEDSLELLDSVAASFKYDHLPTRISHLVLNNEAAGDTEFCRSEPQITATTLTDILKKFPSVVQLTISPCSLNLDDFMFPSRIKRLNLVLSIFPAMSSFRLKLNAPNLEVLTMSRELVDCDTNLTLEGDLSRLRSLAIRDLNVHQIAVKKFPELKTVNIMDFIDTSVFFRKAPNVTVHWNNCELKPLAADAPYTRACGLPIHFE